MAEPKIPTEISWQASEYVEHSRRAGWYLALLAATAILSVATYLITGDKFGAGIIVVLGILVASTAHLKPNKVEYRLNSRGLHVGTKFYDYSQFKYFDVVHEGELRNLVFVPTKRFASHITAFVDADDEPAIIALVGEHLPMQPIGPDRVEALSRRLRF